MDINLKLIALYWFFGLLGYAAHILKTMKQVNWERSIYQYLRAYPLQTSAAFIGFIAALAGIYEMGQLNMTSAFAAGYMANSAADSISGRTIKHLR